MVDRSRHVSERADRPLVTIVTPSYNHGRYIEDTINSVLEQDYPQIEYLVIDGGSTDDTLEILRRYDGRITWVSEPDRGQGHAINKGWARARGAILHWINSDDLLLPGAVSRAVDALASNPDAVAVYGRGQVIDADGSYAGPWPAAPAELTFLTHVDDGILQPSCFARADVVHALGGLDESLNWVNDWDLFIRLFRAGPVVALDAEMAAWRSYPTTKTQSGGITRLVEIVRLLRRWRVPLSAPSYRIHAAYTGTLVVEALRNDRGWKKRVGDGLLPATQRVQQWILGRHRYSGWWPDGWAERRVRHRLRGPGRVLVMRGTVDTRLYPGLEGQRLEIRSGEQAASCGPLGDGVFELRVPIAEHDVDYALIEVTAARWIRPRHLGINDDYRPLAYVLDSATLE